MKRKGLLAFFNNREFDKWCYVYFDTGLLYRYTKLLIIFGGLVRMAITIRLASLDDAKALLDIYRYYVEETAITFEYDVPTLEAYALNHGFLSLSRGRRRWQDSWLCLCF